MKSKLTVKRKGIILAGGKGTRLIPITRSISKQLMPVYDKPMIYYPLTTLMMAGIVEILVIVNKRDLQSFKYLLGDGSQWGISIEFAIQEEPEGIAQAFIIGESFLKGYPSALILGDNLFHGSNLIDLLRRKIIQTSSASIFTYPVSNPQDYGVVNFDKEFTPISIEEKPNKPNSCHAITGLYFYDESVVERAKSIKKSSRDELEITDINKNYLNDNLLNVERMGRGMTWLDTGNFDALHEASSYIRTLEHRQGLKVGCPEELAWRFGLISKEDLITLANNQIKSGYGRYLLKVVESDASSIIYS